ncbi:MAG TPA: plasmid recombination protein, partial [Allocoleopsis sp.]
ASVSMPKAIARIAKLKGGHLGGSLAASEQHTNRDRDTPNANPEVDNLRFIGLPDTEDDRDLQTLVMQRIGNQKIRKNAVLCVEMLLTTSPEFFRPDDPARAGHYERDRLDLFQQTLHQWLNDTYGDRIVRAELHLVDILPPPT